MSVSGLINGGVLFQSHERCAVISTLSEREARDYVDLCPAEHAILSPEQRDILCRLGAFQSPLYLEEKLLAEGKFGSRAEYLEVFTEFKKYVALTRLAGKNLGMPSEKVDAVWHQFILFTPLYHRFCEEYLGEYLHHVPETSHTKNPPGGGRNFVRAYQEVFGRIPTIWEVNSPELLNGTSERGSSCCTTQGCSPSGTPCSTF